VEGRLVRLKFDDLQRASLATLYLSSLSAVAGAQDGAAPEEGEGRAQAQGQVQAASVRHERLGPGEQHGTALLGWAATTALLQ
jgi:hypothetical protein